jgi:hypothetical protein
MVFDHGADSTGMDVLRAHASECVFFCYSIDLQCVELRPHHGASLLAMDTLMDTTAADTLLDNALIYGCL